MAWNRDDAMQWAEIYTKIFPEYGLLIESYMKAQAVEKTLEKRAVRVSACGRTGRR